MPNDSQNPMIEKLKALKSLQDIDEAVLPKLAEGLSYKTVEAGTQLFHAGDSAHVCYIIFYGSIKLFQMTKAGKEVVMCFCQPGDFVGAAIMSNPNPRYPVNSLTVEDCGLIVIPHASYIHNWQTVPAALRAVNLNVMGRMMEFQQDKTYAAAPVPVKIARFLLRTLDQQPSHFGDRLNLPLTRKDVADRVGTTVETTIRTLSTWTQEGIISTDAQHITIHQRQALEQIISDFES